jgi:sugar phosphate isomerase/epimerase
MTPNKSNLNRRQFLQTTALTGIAATLPLSGLAAAAPTRVPVGAPPIKLGVATYTFRNFTRAQMLVYLKQLHIDQINPKDAKDHLPMDPAKEAEAVADYKAHDIHLHAMGTVYFPKDEDDDVRSKFEYAKRAGVKVIVAGDPTPETLPRIEKFVKEYDIKLAIHNHGPEDKLWHSPLDILKVVGSMDPRIGCCIDVGHCVRAGTDPVDAIHQAGPRLFNMHMKDLTDFTTQDGPGSFKARDSQVAVGDGLMPVRRIFEALIATKYQGFVDLEYEVHADDPMPGVIASFAYMRGVIAGMGYPTHA